MRITFVAGAAAALASFASAPVSAQDANSPVIEETVFDEDWIAVGAGIGFVPSYVGSDDYVVLPVPALAGSIEGISISPRAAGVALDFVPEPENGPDFSLGVVGKLNFNRTRRIEDEVVELLGELDTAVEVGPTAGVAFSGVLNPYDQLSFSVDAVFDVAGAHDGATVSPGVTYLTPVSRAAAVSLSLSTQWVSDDYADYYYSVSPAGSVATGGILPSFAADGGFDRYGATLFGGYDLDGDLTNGGLAAFAVGGYSRLTGDAKDTPITSVRGSADQWFVGVGLGYVFGL